VTPKPPSAWRLTPLAVGTFELAYLAYFSHIGKSGNSNLQALAYLSGILVMMSGLVAAGPWLTMVVSRVAAHRARRPATLIAARRMADSPQTAFRAVRGLVLAVFVGTCSLAVITTVVAYNGGLTASSPSARSTVVDQRGPRPDSQMTALPDATAMKLAALPGVTGVALVRVNPDGNQILTSRRGAPPTPGGPAPYVASCAQLVRVPALGHCPPGADNVAIDPDYGGAFIQREAPMAERTWPATDITDAQRDALPIDSVVVGTDGSVNAVERVRSVLEAGYPHRWPPQTVSEIRTQNTSKTDAYRQLADVVILTSLVIAGGGLAVSVAGGLAERKRPFSLLRLSGAPLGVLRRVVAFETAAPLLITAVISAGTGLLAAQLFLRAQLNETLQPPSAQYYLLLGLGVAASLAIIASTFPLLARVTGPDTARSE
jgi:hypothetical protein